MRRKDKQQTMKCLEMVREKIKEKSIFKLVSSYEMT